MPKRIQRKRTKGWKMPRNTVSVTRRGRFGNPFVWQPLVERLGKDAAIEASVLAFQTMIEDRIIAPRHLPEIDAYYRGEPVPSIMEIARNLRGKNLACWCPLDQPCHADVLLRLANS